MKIKQQLELLESTYNKLYSDDSLEAQFQKELYNREINHLKNELYYSWSYRDKSGELVDTSLYALTDHHLLMVARKCFELNWREKYYASLAVIKQRFTVKEGFDSAAVKLKQKGLKVFDKYSKHYMFEVFLNQYVIN